MDFKELLELGVQKEIISNEQKTNLLNLVSNADEKVKQTSSVVETFYYLGGFIMLCAMTSLMSQTIQHSTYTMILTLGAFYAALFIGIGEFLWRKNEKFPAGILYFLFITAIAFIILDIEKMTGFFPHFSDIDKHSNYFDMCRFPTLVLSSLTIIVNTYLQKYRKTDLLAIPTVGCSYAIYTAILHFILGDKMFDGNPFAIYNLVFSVALFVIAFIKDRITCVDYSKWMYFGSSIGILTTIMMLLSEHNVPEHPFQFIVFVVCLIYCFTGMLIQRKPFSIIGILGVIEYLMYLEFTYIKNYTMLLTSSVIITGLLILYTGVLYNKNADKISEFIIGKFPEKIRKLMPQNR